MNGTESTARELLGAWALDAVDDLERVVVERAIASDEELADEARQLRETVSRIAEADAQQPPEQVRQAVFARIHQTASEADQQQRGTNPVQRPQDEPVSRRDSGSDHDELARMRRRRRWQGLAAAAAVVVAVAIPTAVAIDQSDRAEQAELQAEQTQEQADQSQQQADQIAEALMDPAAEMVSEDLPDGSRAVGVLGADSALFAAQNMTELEDQDYQLWVLDGDEAISAGVMDWEDGALTAHVEQFPDDAALAVTAEPVGGSDQPTSDPMVVLAAG